MVLTYHPALNYCGTDSVTYRVMDSSLSISNTGTINITVTCVNDAPVASPDTATGAIEDTSVLIPVLTNDTDVDVGDVLSVSSLTQPGTGGTVQISGSNILFVPTPNYCTPNPISFTYRARDIAGALSPITTVTIDSIVCINDTPISMPSNRTMTGNVVINPGTMLSG